MADEVTLAELVRNLEDSVSKVAMRLPAQSKAERMSREELLKTLKGATVQLGVALGCIDALEKLVLDHRIGHYTTQYAETTEVQE
jgi:hypothetical protein